MAVRGSLRLRACGSRVHFLWHPPADKVRAAVVFMGGTAQTINNVTGHHGPLARGRGGLLHYEMRGQGTTTTLSHKDCTLARQVEDFRAVLDAAEDEGLIGSSTQIDLVGFSFGARVALACVAERHERIRRLVITGAPADRGAAGRIMLRSWLTSLNRGDLEGFLWQTISDGHSERFLSRHEHRLAGWVRSAAEQNDVKAILGLVRDSHVEDEGSIWHTVSLAKRAACVLRPEDGLFITGGEDRLATPVQVAKLAAIGDWSYEEIAGVGHPVLIEQPKKWRKLVIGHLDK